MFITKKHLSRRHVLQGLGVAVSPYSGGSIGFDGLFIIKPDGRVQFQSGSTRRRERRTAALYALSRELAATRSPDQIARIAVQHVTAALDSRISAAVSMTARTILS